jgi:hypothetical protein
MSKLQSQAGRLRHAGDVLKTVDAPPLSSILEKLALANWLNTVTLCGLGI